MWFCQFVRPLDVESRNNELLFASDRAFFPDICVSSRCEHACVLCQHCVVASDNASTLAAGAVE